MKKTNYGIKEKGKSGFVIVAPHAAGDDLKTGEIAQSIAKQLKASLVVNEKYVKPTNSKAGVKPVRDFNRLPFKKNGKYEWSGKREDKHMKEFYDDIEKIAKSINKPVIVFIHGMIDRYGIDIDIGCGAKYDKKDGKLKGTEKPDKHPKAGESTGIITANLKKMEELKKFFCDRDQKTDIGRKFAAWSKRNGVQYHTGTPHGSFQLEITSRLRKKNKLNYTSRIIAEALKSIYK